MSRDSSRVSRLRRRVTRLHGDKWRVVWRNAMRVKRETILITSNF